MPLFLSGILLVLLVAVFLRQYTGLKNEINSLHEGHEKLIRSLSETRNGQRLAYALLYYVVQHEDTPIQDGEVFFGIDSVSCHMWRNIVQRPRLFFYFSQTYCAPCVEDCFDLIKESFPDFIEDSTCIVISDIPMKYQRNFTEKAMLNQFQMPFDEPGIPCFFIIDADMRIKYLHFFNKDDKNATQIYLKGIKNKIFPDVSTE